MPAKKLLIFPFNGNGLEALDCIDPEQYDVLGFIDDDCCKHSDEYALFSREALSRYKEALVLAVPGSTESYIRRADIISSLQLPRERFATVIHQNAAIGKSVTIGFNSLIMAGVVLTSNAVIGNHVCILPNSVVHHDSIIHDFTLIGSNVVIAGGCSIGSNCYIGSGTNVINGIAIGRFSLIGLGANVIRAVEENAKVVGNPARNLQKQLV